MALHGKTAVVTGAALGIGKAITEILLQNGAKVTLLDINETAGKTLKEALNKQYGEERSLFFECNVESEEQIKGLTPVPACPIYTATKHAVVGFTRAMAAASSASGYGLCFNAVCPSLVKTDLFASLIDNLGQFSHLAYATQCSSVERAMNPSEVAECVFELVTGEAKNGEILMKKASMKKYMTFPTLI